MVADDDEAVLLKSMLLKQVMPLFDLSNFELIYLDSWK